MENKIPNPDIIGYEGSVGYEKALRQTHWQHHGVKLRKTRDNGYVWVSLGQRQVRMKRIEALEEGLEIIRDANGGAKARR